MVVFVQSREGERVLATYGRKCLAVESLSCSPLVTVHEMKLLFAIYGDNAYFTRRR